MPQAVQLLVAANAILILWTMGFGYIMMVRRISSVKAGRAPGAHYVTFSKGQEPDFLAVLTRQYANLHENPMLFYVISLFALAIGVVDMTFSTLAAGYVIARMAHTIIHVTVNPVLVRFAVFLVATLLVTAMAVKLLLAVV